MGIEVREPIPGNPAPIECDCGDCDSTGPAFSVLICPVCGEDFPCTTDHTKEVG